MPKAYSAFCPDIDPPRDRTAELIHELVQSWRDGTNAGAGEVAAAAAFLTDPHQLPLTYNLLEKGPLGDFLTDFHQFLLETPSQPVPFVERIKAERGWQQIPLHIMGFASATGAIYSTLAAATVAGGEVITTSLNYTAVPNAIMMAGATPLFVDVDPATWCMDVGACSRAISPSTRAIVLTHVNRFADIEPFHDLFKRRGLNIPLIQDASLAVGSTRSGVRPGLINLGRGGVTVMSLTVSKVISGLAGAVAVANDPEFLWHAAEIAHQGIPFYDPTVITTFGSNFKMNAINAVLAHEQLRRRDRIFERRRILRAAYERHLKALVDAKRLALQDPGDEAVMTYFGVILPMARDPVAKILQERHFVQTGIWHVHHQQKIFRLLLAPKIPRLPETDRIGPRLLFLPFHTMLTEEDVAAICQALSAAIDEARTIETQWTWKPKEGTARAVKGKRTAAPKTKGRGKAKRPRRRR